MTKFTPTPGPWTANEEGEIWRHYRDEQGNRVSMPIGEAVTVPGHESEQLPNARLMASSPELLKALEEMLARSGDPNAVTGEFDTTDGRARRLIQRITGTKVHS
jgi:hypothetical protein